MRVLDLFSGIGGFSLGLARSGMETAAFCEIEPFCQKILKKHWPDVPVYKDIKELDGKQFKGTIDLICGGFPCQDISVAGKGAGLAGERSGLWAEYKRLIDEINPQFIAIENVANLRNLGLIRVLKDLWALGYDAEWHIIPACAVGAPHKRERIWIIAYPISERLQGSIFTTERICQLSKASSAKFGDENIHVGAGWPKLSTYLRVGDGLSRWSHEIKALGNAVVPQIPELIGRAILRYSESS